MTEDEEGADEDVDDEEVAEPMEIDEEDELTFLEAQECLRKLKANASKLKVPASATIHLDRYAKALRAAEAEKPKKDGTLHSHFIITKKTKAKKWLPRTNESWRM